MTEALEEEVKTLSEEFSRKLGFLDVESMKETANRFKEMLGDDYSRSDHENSSYSECVSPSQDVLVRKSLCVANLMSSDDEEEVVKEERKPRKSRKSVCVLPKIVMSSSEEGTASESDDEDDEIINKKNRKKKNFLDSNSEDENSCEENGNSDKEVAFKDATKKKINYISSSDEDQNDVSTASDDSCHEISILSQSLKKQTLHSEESESEEDEGSYENFISSIKKKNKPSSEYDSNDDSEGSLRDFIVRDKENESDESKDDIVENDKEDFQPTVMKTPLPRPKQVLKERNIQKFMTPHSQSRRIINAFCTPKSVPGTPAYKRDFNRKRDQTVSELFELFNKTVFGSQLPADLQITWNKRMTKTAGFCYYSKSLGVKKCRIEFSDKVIDSPERIRDTLIHELCHAATWLINGVQAGHGPSWKHWAKKANMIHPDLPIIARCHQYEIHTKYTYQCNGCGATFGRHSKSIDAKKHRCAACGGIPELQGDKSSVSATPKTPNGYALFVKEHFATVKKSNPGKSHREIMMLISEKYKKSKADDNK